MHLGEILQIICIKHNYFLSLVTALTRIINVRDPIMFIVAFSRPLLGLRLHSTVVSSLFTLLLDLPEPLLQGLGEAAARGAASAAGDLAVLGIAAGVAVGVAAVCLGLSLGLLARPPPPLGLGGAVRKPRAAGPAPRPRPPPLPLQLLRDVGELQLPVLLLQAEQLVLQLLEVDHGVDLTEHVNQLLLLLLQCGDLLPQ